MHHPQAGCIIRDGRARIGYAFQEPRLLPGKTVAENVRWVLGGRERESGDGRINGYLEAAGLGHVLSHYPDQLSGGMRQRVSLVRAFAVNPGLLLMDEPFQGLDAATRRDMQQILLRLWRRTKPTVLLVTHDPDEAMALGSHILVLGGDPVTCVYRAAAVNEAGAARFSLRDAKAIQQITGGREPDIPRRLDHETLTYAHELG